MAVATGHARVMAIRRSTIHRHGRRLLKQTSGQRGRACFEYFGHPLDGIGAHKLGQIQRVGSGTIRALRGMRAGTQLKEDFATMRDAEDWIALCDTWGPLQGDAGEKIAAAATTE